MEKKLYVGQFLLCQVNALTKLICHIGPPMSLVTMINLSSKKYLICMEVDSIIGNSEFIMKNVGIARVLKHNFTDFQFI